MSEATPNRRQVVLRVAALFAIAAGLVVAFLLLQLVSEPAVDTSPLYPNDTMVDWQQANPAQKRATAELLLDEMQSEGIFNPATQPKLDNPDSRQKLVDELIASLDAATMRNRLEYVSPSRPIILTAKTAANGMGWTD